MGEGFVEPEWDTPLDTAPFVHATPTTAYIRGMYPATIVENARLRGLVLAAARERYFAFQHVPMREYLDLLVEAAGVYFPEVSLRQGLRKLGRSTYEVFAQSVVGRVVLSAADDFPGVVAAAVKGYAISMPPARADVLDIGPRRAIVTFAGVYNFLDPHHVGVFEGLAHSCGVRVTTRVRLASVHTGDFELTW
jgi:uncharacterized protein (TIGR02265 family)